ncbi:Glutaredoxin [Kalmanozyma brasiliensis GHG001]|uniref:Glutaredoxin domain-containing protein n=1 Tax=Kalmanozyma brasiliensis (strain GHG001) TaxID=1365824 RepID=V5EA74_KALBG|nr:Glutaredoxin [Kalmanozyma brasiliensis GHG001]EST07281.1 Glutaredoxin [Kalmanozyma brasiliensis GHG001]
MGAEAKEHLLQDLESGTASPSRAPVFCLPPFTLLRRKKLLVLLLLVPTVYFLLIYNGNAPSPLASKAGAHVLDTLQQAAPAINELAGKLPIVGHTDDAHLDSEGHLHNALLDTMHVEGTAELSKLKNQLEHDTSTKASTTSKNADLAAQVSELTKFDAKDESVMLLLLALHIKGYQVDDDWQQVYFDRTPLQKGILSLNTGPSNKFTQLLAQVGLPRPKEAANSTAVSSSQFSILEDAHQLYSLSRQDWVSKVRPSLGLTVFSKSYCPYSKKAKALLHSLNATFTVYEVDQRPDAHQLQPLLAKLTGHRTFPTILVRDRLLGGSDDLQDLQSLHALKSILESIGSL